MVLSDSSRQLTPRTVGEVLEKSTESFWEYDFQVDRFINNDADKSFEKLYEGAASLLISVIDSCFIADTKSDRYEVEKRLRHCVLKKLREAEKKSLNR